MRKTKSIKPIYHVRYVFKNGSISERILGPVVLKLVDSTGGEKSTRIDLPDGFVLGGYLHRGGCFIPYNSREICESEIDAILHVVNASKKEKENLIKRLNRVIAIWPEDKK